MPASSFLPPGYEGGSSVGGRSGKALVPARKIRTGSGSITSEEWKKLPPEAKEYILTRNPNVLPQGNLELQGLLDEMISGRRPVATMDTPERLDQGLLALGKQADAAGIRLGGGISQAYGDAGDTTSQLSPYLQQAIARGDIGEKGGYGDQLARAQAESGGAVGGEDGGGGGILGGVMNAVSSVGDIFSRGQYATWEGINRAASLLTGEGETEEGAPSDTPDDILWGILGGLQGKHKTGVEHVLANVGEYEDPSKLPAWAKGVAVMGNIVLDPLNLVGAGLVGKAFKGVDLGMDVFKAVENAEDVVHAATQAGKSVNAAADEGAKTAKELSDLLGYSDEMADRVGDELLYDENWLKARAIEIGTSPQVQHRASLEIRNDVIREVGGMAEWKKLSPIEQAQRIAAGRANAVDASTFAAAESMRASGMGPEAGRVLRLSVGIGDARIAREFPNFSRMVGSVVKKAGDAPYVQTLRKMVSGNAAYGKSANYLRRVVENAANGRFTMAARASRNAIKTALTDPHTGKVRKLLKNDHEIIARALQTNNIDQLPSHLQPVAKYAQDQFNVMHADLIDRGFYSTAESMQNGFFPVYLRKGWKKGDKEAVRQIRLTEDRLGGVKNMDNAFDSLTEKYAGDQVFNLDSVLTMAYRDYYEKVYRNNFFKSYVSFFGGTVKSTIDKRGNLIPVNKFEAAKQVKLSKEMDEAGKVLVGKGLKSRESVRRFFGGVFDDQRVFIPHEHAEVFNAIVDMTMFDDVTRNFTGQYRRIVQGMKTAMTLPNPGFHIRNMRGDIFLNLMDGVTSPRRYGQAWRILTAQRGAQFVPGGAVGETIVESLDDFFIPIAGQRINAGKIFNWYNTSGARTGNLATERRIIEDSSKLTNKFVKPLRAFTEGREEWGRLTHFIDALDKETKAAGGVVNQAVLSRAAGRVRKYNIDYGDLTPTEKKLRAYAIPFYTWMRKNIPLQMEMMMTRPAFAAGVFKGTNTFKKWMSEDPNNDFLAPEWLRELLPARVDRSPITNFFLGGAAGAFIPGAATGAIPGESGLLGTDTYFTGFNEIPMFDALNRIDPLVSAGAGLLQGKNVLDQTLRDVGKQVANQLNPMLSGGIQAATGTNVFTGAQEDFSTGRYTTNIMPMLKSIGPILEQLQSGGQGVEGDPVEIARALNFLFATGTQVVTPQRKIGEMKRLEDIFGEMRQGRREEAADYLGVRGE